MPTSNRPRILLLIPHLGGGGAERVIETLARCLNSNSYEIHLALVTCSEHSPPPLPGSVTLHKLHARRVRTSVLKLLLLIWQVRPSVIMSGIAHLNLLVLLLRPLLPRKTRIIVRQNGALTATLSAHVSPHLAHSAYSLAYRGANSIICQTNAMAEEVSRDLRIPPARLAILSNPTDLRRIRTLVAPSTSKPIATGNSYLLAVGRLVHEKGFDLLLDAFAALAPRFPSAELVIAGDGPARSSLERQVANLEIQHRIHFPGYTPDPIIQFGNATAFVLSSRTEGLPNALLEAAAAGLPMVSTPASSGLTELLQGRDGVWLTSDISVSALRRALEQALTSIQPGQRFAHPWIENFDFSRAIPAYETTIDGVLARSSL